MIEVFPVALADLKLSPESLSQKMRTDGLVRVLSAKDGWHHVEAIGGCVVGESVPDD